mmetsp:Transcript_27948/g.89037  ORF Transcript_27948/g.89037 Transcript_27948/m.89037 type:complete len:433 (+) Transcript_27948:184-1482(+)
MAGMTFEGAAAGGRGLGAEFNLEQLSQVVPSTFENTTFRSAPAVATLHAAPLGAAARAMPMPGRVPLSFAPGAGPKAPAALPLEPTAIGKAPLQTVVAPSSAAAVAVPSTADDAVAEQFVVGPVPPFPFELEPRTVVKAEFGGHAEAARAVMGGLRAEGVDFEADPAAARFRCTACCAAAYVTLTVSLYMSAGAYLVEVQRRSGEGMAFMCVYRKLKACLTGATLPATPANSALNFGLQMPSLPASLLAMCDPAPAIDAVEEVRVPVSMLESDYLDVQHEGVRCLSELAADAAARDRVCGCEKAVEAAVAGLGRFIAATVQVESRSFAAFALANLTEQAAVADCLVNSPQAAAVLGTLAGFARNGGVEDAQMRRESARALANVAGRHGAKVAALLGRDALSDLASALGTLSDPTVRGYAESVSRGCALQTVA